VLAASIIRAIALTTRRNNQEDSHLHDVTESFPPFTDDKFTEEFSAMNQTTD
jgi:hypothetical protein